MNNNALHTVEAQIREQAAAYCESNNVPGFVAGVYHAGEQIVVAHGTANVATDAPMLADTGFLFTSFDCAYRWAASAGPGRRTAAPPRQDCQR